MSSPKVRNETSGSIEKGELKNAIERAKAKVYRQRYHEHLKTLHPDKYEEFKAKNRNYVKDYRQRTKSLRNDLKGKRANSESYWRKLKNEGPEIWSKDKQ